MDQWEDEVLSDINLDAVHLTKRQAQVWVLRVKGVSQSQIAKQWGTSRANICMLEKAARANIQKARETVMFDEQLRAPLRMMCHPGELLLDIPPRLYRLADQANIKVNSDGPMVMQIILDQAAGCVKDNRFTRTVLLMVTASGNLMARHVALQQQDNAQNQE